MADALLHQHDDNGSFYGISVPSFGIIHSLKNEYTDLPEFCTVLTDLEQGKTMKWPLQMRNQLLYGTGIFVVSQSQLIPLSIKEYHNSPASGHFGAYKTNKRLATEFFWKR